MFVQTFWRNPEISRLSRLFLVFVLTLIPGAGFAAAYYVAPISCVADLRSIFGLEIAVLIAHSVYFWMADRPKVLHSFSRLMNSGRLEIRKKGFGHELWMDGRYVGRFVLAPLIALSIVLVAIVVSGSWFDQPLLLTCQRRLIGSPPIPVIATGVSFIIIILFELLLWVLSTPPVWRLRTASH